MIDFSIIIPTWNGRLLLEKNLPRVLAAVRGQKAEIIIVDDGSTDQTAKFLKNLVFKDLMNQFIELNRNYGFSHACNLGVSKARGEIVVLLNNDVVPERNFLEPLKKDFKNPKIFAVSFHEPQFSWAQAFWQAGFVQHRPGPKTKKACFSFWASGGSAAFRKIIWLELGGFDYLFQPFYWEDVDLCYRAWKRGFQILWEPDSIVHHRHESTISQFSPRYVSLITQRNELLFVWKNIVSPGLFKEHQQALIKRIFKNPGYSRIFLAAMVKLPQVLPQRSQEKREARLKDEEIFELFKKR
jgi:GT2 family glycosyltransferase